MTGIKRLRKISEQDTMLVPKFEGFVVDNDGLMRYNNWIYVPPNDELRSLILNEAHRVVYMAHPGVTKMREDLKPLFFWKGMKEGHSQLRGEMSRMSASEG
jgi:hypothetical protein